MNRTAAHFRVTLALVTVLLMAMGMAFAQPADDSTAMPDVAEESADNPPPPDIMPLPTGDAPAQTVYMRFVNSRTGLGVAPKSIMVDGQPVKFDVARQSLVALPVPVGSHTIDVTAEGCEPMRVDVTATDGGTPVIEVELDPSAPAPEAEVDADKALLIGTVSDADTAEPISDAELKIVDSALSQKTTGSGEFRFEVTTGNGPAPMRPAVTLEIQAKGYAPQRLKNLMLDPGGRARVPVRLSQETSATEEMAEVDMGHTPGGNYAANWTFDVTLR